MLTRNKIIVLIFAFVLLYVFSNRPSLVQNNNIANATDNRWKVLSIDTMKYSRDLAREKINDASFDQNIEDQVKKIADTGATHIAIGTPYDEEFISYLVRWVKVARKNNLNVWFRGNFSGWEKWFDYQHISRQEHTKLVSQFIEKNESLFVDGDIFSTCPECENGGPGDPRMTGDHVAYRQFIINEYRTAQSAFKKINKIVASNYFSMNGDVARLIMDKETTKSLDGIVVIDHYVKDPQKLVDDARDIAKNSGGKVVLGEFGAPIPDIHGTMDEITQAMWIDSALNLIYQTPEIVGMNYWTNFGGTTQLWNNDGSARSAVDTIQNFYTQTEIVGQVVNDLNKPIDMVALTTPTKNMSTDKNGRFQITTRTIDTITFTKTGYFSKQIPAKELRNTSVVVMQKENPDLLFFFAKLINSLFN